MLKEQETIFKQINKAVQIFTASDGKLRPHFFLTGPSGSGKSHLAAYVAEQNDLGIIEVNAAQLTKEGVSGNSLSKALAPLAQCSNRLTIVFIDEFDKLFITGNNNSELAHESTTAVQNEFLRVLESKTTSIFGDYGKYNNVAVDKTLFIFAGAFNGEENITLDRLRELGVKTEFLGRVGLIYNLSKLSIDSMRAALVNSKLLENYLKLFPKAKRDKCIEDIMVQIEKTFEQNTLGIRVINTLLHQYFINGGKLTEDQVNKTTFTKTLELNNE